jgi:hypothetical protein
MPLLILLNSHETDPPMYIKGIVQRKLRGVKFYINQFFFLTRDCLALDFIIFQPPFLCFSTRFYVTYWYSRMKTKGCCCVILLLAGFSFIPILLAGFL